jgi:diguanylate cyclase (GGDEF)-like protein
MSYQAMHDALTGLINRAELTRRLKETLDRAHRGEGRHLLAWFDLERLRVVNDAAGSHQAGDAVLREAAKLLTQAVRGSDTVARVGGDEFAILLTACPLTKGRQIVEDLCSAMSRHRFAWKERVFNLSVSGGLIELSRESGTGEDALIAAEAACHIARRQGAGRVLVYSAHDEALARHSGEIRALAELADALAESRFELHQQPIVADTGHEEGPALEVLVRLKDESGHELPPVELLRAAERHQLMGRIDRWVVHTTLSAIARGGLKVPAARSVAINVSGQTLADAQFLHYVVESLDSTGVAPGQICFEISERAVAAQPQAARRFVAVLRGMGCHFALDEFGAHGGSLTGLASLPLDYVKIDGCLVRSLATDPLNQALVSSMIRLARSLRCKVIAESVEDSAALEAVRRLGVDYVQGPLIGRPAPLDLTAP